MNDTTQIHARVRLLVVDDQSMVRQGLRMRLSLEPDLEVAGEASDGLAALEMSRALQPDAVLMDIEMPRMDGLTATKALRAAMPGTPVIAVSLHGDSRTRSRALAAGAREFVCKHDGAEALLAAIRRSVRGVSQA